MRDAYVMFVIMIISGLLSSMNIWSSKWSDIRLSLNDFYMAFLMTGWMFFLMGVYYTHSTPIFFGLSVILLGIWLIRTQFLINLTQYKLGMIPHHSMAIFMSKKLLEKNPPNNEFLLSLIHRQEKEIEYLKSL